VYDGSKMDLKWKNTQVYELESSVFGQVISGRFLWM